MALYSSLPPVSTGFCSVPPIRDVVRDINGVSKVQHVVLQKSRCVRDHELTPATHMSEAPQTELGLRVCTRRFCSATSAAEPEKRDLAGTSKQGTFPGTWVIDALSACPCSVFCGAVTSAGMANTGAGVPDGALASSRGP